MRCHTGQGEGISTEGDELKILLMGNPNVGKSVVFAKLTGREVLSANYTGTTIDFTSGKVSHRGKKGVMIDVPGTYSLEATSPAEEVALRLLEEGADVVVCVLDATNLERNLNLAVQLRQHNIPLVFALNLIDVAERQGIIIDVDALGEELGAPVIPTVAIRNVGLRELLDQVWKLPEQSPQSPKNIITSQKERWQEVGRITEKVQRIEHRHPSFWERMGDLTLQPFPGLPIAFLVLGIALAIVVGGGKALRGLILLPLVNGVIVPFLTSIVSRIVPEGVFLNILVGEYGVLVKGIEWPFALILPYVLLFYIVLSFLEDSGYLPRIGVLVDGMLRRFGIQGGNIVPFIMGYGCAVPAILGTRASTSYKERLIVTILICLAVPCAAQTGAFFSLLGDRSVLVLVLMYIISFVALVVGGIVLNKVIPGTTSPMLLEIPNLLKPNGEALLKKIAIRFRHFMFEAEVPMLLGIGLAALVVETGLLDSISIYLQPLVVGWLGLPPDASLALMLGVIRRELAVLPLLEMELTTLQLLVGSVVSLFYLPCLSVFAALLKEFGLKVSLLVVSVTIFTAFFIAGVINQVVGLVIAVI